MKLANSLFGLTLLQLLLFSSARGTTIISIKYPPQSSVDRAQPAKRDLSLSYAATNIDSKEGTRVKTITVIKNVGGDSAPVDHSSTNTNKKPSRLAINPELHKNEEWASAFRDNFDTYGVLPDVPDIDDLFEFVNRKKPVSSTSSSGSNNGGVSVSGGSEVSSVVGSVEKKPESTTSKATTTVATESAEAEELPVEKIKGDAELLPHIKEANILRMQADMQTKTLAEPATRRLRTRESLIHVNYSTPMHKVTQYFDNYVQALPNGYDYSKPCAYPPPNSIPVTTPSGRKYDIPLGNSSGTGGGNHPYLAPALTKKTQVLPTPQNVSPSLPPNYASVNSIVPPIIQQAQPQPQPPLPAPTVPLQPQPQPQLPPNGAIPPTPPSLAIAGGGISTSQRPYVAPSLRNNGLGINRGPPTTSLQPQSPTLLPPVPIYRTGPSPSFRTNVFGGAANRPKTFRSRGLKY